MCLASFSLLSISRAKPRGGSDPQGSVWRGQATTENGVQVRGQEDLGKQNKESSPLGEPGRPGREKEEGVRGGKVESEACFSGLVPGSWVPTLDYQ